MSPRGEMCAECGAPWHGVNPSDTELEARARTAWLQDMARNRRVFRIAMLRQVVEIHDLLIERGEASKP